MDRTKRRDPTACRAALAAKCVRPAGTCDDAEVARLRTDDLLLGEWACLAILVHGRAHGYDVSLQLAKGSSIGRVWTLSRPLTYRSLDQLTQRGLIAPVREDAAWPVATAPSSRRRRRVGPVCVGGCANRSSTCATSAASSSSSSSSVTSSAPARARCWRRNGPTSRRWRPPSPRRRATSSIPSPSGATSRPEPSCASSTGCSPVEAAGRGDDVRAVVALSGGVDDDVGGLDRGPDLVAGTEVEVDQGGGGDLGDDREVTGEGDPVRSWSWSTSSTVSRQTLRALLSGRWRWSDTACGRMAT